MAKRKASSRKRIDKPPPQNTKVISTHTGGKGMINCLIVLVMILPVLFSRVTMDANLTVRYIFLSWFLLFFVLFFFVLKRMQVNFSFAPLIKVVFWLGIGYGIWSLVSMFFAINIATAWYEVARHFLNIILLFMIMESVRREESQVLKLCKALVIASLIQSLVGILQNYDLAFMDIPGGAAPNGLMGNRNLFGSAQALLLPFVIFVLYKGSVGWKFTGIVSFIGIITSVFVSQTRSAWLAAMVGIVITIILLLFFSRSNRKKWIAGILSGTIGIAAIIWMLFITHHDSSFSKSVKGLGYTLINPSLDDSTSAGRTSLWSKSLLLIGDHPVFGVGPGNWKLGIPAYAGENPAFANGLYLPSWPHNVYLQTASETGIPGALLYFSIWILLAIMGFKIIRKSHSEDVRVLIMLMLSGVAAFATDAMFSFPTERIEHSLYIILMSGIIMGYYANLFETEMPVQPVNKKQKSINKKLLIFLLATIVFNIFLGHKKYNLEKHVNLAKAYRNQHLNEDVLIEVEAGKSKFVQLDPDGEPLEIHSAAAYTELKYYDKALKEIRVANRYHPGSARILSTMGLIYAELKQYDDAIKCYLQVLKLTPKYKVALKNLARIYFGLGRYGDCIETIGKMDVGNEEEMANMLIEAKKKVNEARN